MPLDMTASAQWNNIKPMARGISQMMMVLCRRSAAIAARENGSAYHSPLFDLIADCTRRLSLYLFGWRHSSPLLSNPYAATVNTCSSAAITPTFVAIKLRVLPPRTTFVAPFQTIINICYILLNRYPYLASGNLEYTSTRTH